MHRFLPHFLLVADCCQLSFALDSAYSGSRGRSAIHRKALLRSAALSTSRDPSPPRTEEALVNLAGVVGSIGRQDHIHPAKRFEEFLDDDAASFAVNLSRVPLIAELPTFSFPRGHLEESEQVEPTSPAYDSRSDDYDAWDLIIVIPSHASEFDRRETVRNTWLQYTSSARCQPCIAHSVKAFFVVGSEGDQQKVEREIAQHGDVVVLKGFAQDAYYSDRAEKTRLSIKYAVQHYNFKLLLKVDTDSWVFMDRLLIFLQEHDLWDASAVYAGNFKVGQRATPSKDENSKWYDPTFGNATGMIKYPKHAKGAGYLLSRDLCAYIANGDAFLKLPSEDVSVGFWLFPIEHQTVEMPISVNPCCSCTAKESSDNRASLKDDSLASSKSIAERAIALLVDSWGEEVRSKNKHIPKKLPAVIDHYLTKDAMYSRWQSYLFSGDTCAWPAWRTAPWSSCFVIYNDEEVPASTANQCGDGQRRRLVECFAISSRNSIDVSVPETCKAAVAPKSTVSCHAPCKPHQPWVVSAWSPCPDPCVRDAVQTRKVECLTTDCSGPSPVSQRRCPRCRWVATDWSECHGLSCSGKSLGTRIRQVVCDGLSEADCDFRRRPELNQNCNGKPTSCNVSGTRPKGLEYDEHSGRFANQKLCFGAHRHDALVISQNSPSTSPRGVTRLAQLTLASHDAYFGFMCSAKRQDAFAILRSWSKFTWSWDAQRCERPEVRNKRVDFRKDAWRDYADPARWTLFIAQCDGDAIEHDECIPCPFDNRVRSYVVFLIINCFLLVSVAILVYVLLQVHKRFKQGMPMKSKRAPLQTKSARC